jgi:hypothetical protein
LLSCVGDPPATGPCWATVSRCKVPGLRGPHVVVRLYDAEADARAALEQGCGCGVDCQRRHELLALHETAEVSLDGAARPARPSRPSWADDRPSR